MIVSSIDAAAAETHGWIGAVEVILLNVAFAIQVIGALVLVWGVALGIIGFFRIEACRLRGDDTAAAKTRLRRSLGYYILLGLEILIIADIMETIGRPDLNSLIVLGIIVAIRTVISFSLHWELRGDAANERKATG